MKLGYYSTGIFANVVIPAGKKDNQQYWIKDFETKERLGNFISIKIFGSPKKVMI
jgi:hypothetical protein